MKITTLIVLLTISFGGFAQQLHKTTTKANSAFDKGLWSAAIENFRVAIKKEKDNEVKLDIMYKMAQSYAGAKEYKNAITWFKKVEAKGGSFLEKNPEIHLKMAEAYKAMERYEDAMASYDKFSELKPNDENAKKGKKSCELALKWTENPTRYKVDNVRQLNSKYDDAIPTYSDKRYKSIIFQSYRNGATGKGENEVNGQAFPDLYEAKLDRSGKWTKPVPVEGDEKLGVNSPAAEGAPAMNSRKNELYFTRCAAKKSKEDVVQSCQILKAKKRGQAFAEAVILPIGGDTLIVAHPALAEKDQKLYFVSNMEGGMGGKDIWVADYDKKERKWVNVRNLGPEVNTPGDELYPFIHADGTLYFSSNGHVGIGGFDLFKVEALEDGWGPVMNLKVPLNSSADDVAIIFEDDAERGYLTSNRAEGRGRMDVYSFNLPPLVLFIEGVVKDANTKEILPNSKVTMTGSDGSSVEAVTDETGSFKFELAPNTTYQLQASNDTTRKNQFGLDVLKYFTSEKALVSTIGMEDSKTFVQDLLLEPIPEKGIELPNIVYDFNKATLKDESKLKLNGLVKTLKENPSLVIELGSHTDFRGSAEYNRKLAQRRAQSAVDYLISKGIPKERMVAKGYGEDAPKEIDSAYVEKAYFGKDDVDPTAADYKTVTKKGKTVTASFEEQKKTFVAGMKLDEATINSLPTEGLQECAHQMNRRTEFKVLRTDYKPGESATGKQ